MLHPWALKNRVQGNNPGDRNMEKTLISGASRGIGLEFTKQCLGRGDQVVACCRNPAEAGQLASLAGPNLTVVELDVSDSISIETLPDRLPELTYSLFINNAGIYGQSQSLDQADPDEWLRIFRVNTIAPLLVTRALLPRMSTSGDARLVYLSSRMGSIAENTSGGTYVYRSSKTALNQVVKSLALDLAGRGMAVAALHPGWVQTDMTGPNALIDTRTSVKGLMAVIDALTLEKSGRFYNYDGSEIPW